MPRYEVELQLTAIVWVDVEADDEDEAVEYARKTYSISDAHHAVIDWSTKQYTEKEA